MQEGGNSPTPNPSAMSDPKSASNPQRQGTSKLRAAANEVGRLQKEKEDFDRRQRLAKVEEERKKRLAESKRQTGTTSRTGAGGASKGDGKPAAEVQRQQAAPSKPKLTELRAHEPRQQKPQVEDVVRPLTPEREESPDTSPFGTPEEQSYKEEFPTPEEASARKKPPPRPPPRAAPPKSSPSGDSWSEPTRQQSAHQGAGGAAGGPEQGAGHPSQQQAQGGQRPSAQRDGEGDRREAPEPPREGGAGNAGAGGGPPNQPPHSSSESSEDEGDQQNSDMESAEQQAARMRRELAQTAFEKARVAATLTLDHVRANVAMVDVTGNPGGARNMLPVFREQLTKMETLDVELEQQFGFLRNVQEAGRDLAETFKESKDEAKRTLTQARTELLQSMSRIDGAVKDVFTKPNTSLKPEALTFDNTPTELDHWKTQFEGYYNTSRFSNLGQTEQEAYLISCLNSDVAAVLQSWKETDRTKHNYVIEKRTVAGIEIPSMLDLLDRMWLDRYPLFRRRHEYFTMEFQGSLRDLPKFLAKLEKAFRVAKVSELTADKLNAYRALSAIKDEELRRLCWREEDLSWDRLRSLAYQRVKEVENKNHGKSVREKANATKEWKCYVCQKPGHMAKNCPQVKQFKSGQKKVHKGRQADGQEDAEEEAEADPTEEDRALKAGQRKPQRKQQQQGMKKKAHGRQAQHEEGSENAFASSDL